MLILAVTGAARGVICLISHKLVKEGRTGKPSVRFRYSEVTPVLDAAGQCCRRHEGGDKTNFRLLVPRAFQGATIEFSAPGVLPGRFGLADFRDSNTYRIEIMAQDAPTWWRYEPMRNPALQPGERNSDPSGKPCQCRYRYDWDSLLAHPSHPLQRLIARSCRKSRAR